MLIILSHWLLTLAVLQLRSFGQLRSISKLRESQKLMSGLQLLGHLSGFPHDEQLNSLAPWRFEWNFRWIILKLILVISGWGGSCEIALRWTSVDLLGDRSTLVQVMAWCHQATNHYLSQCWPISMSPYSVSRPQWVKIMLKSCLLALLLASQRQTYCQVNGRLGIDYLR